jgi:type VI protein secretion system component VasF
VSETVAELRAMTDEQLIENHDRRATQTSVGTRHYLDELRHRDAARHELAVIKATEQVRTLTWWIVALTFVNVVLVAWTILKPPA